MKQLSKNLDVDYDEFLTVILSLNIPKVFNMSKYIE